MINLHNFAEERAEKEKEAEQLKREKLAQKIAKSNQRNTAAYKGASASDASLKEEPDGNQISIVSAEDAMKVILHL
jgi:hypothetical protein